MNPKDMKPLEKIDVMGNVLDKLSDAQGRIKCGYIYVLDDILTNLKNDILIMEAKLKDFENNQNGEESSETVSPE